MNAFSTVQLDTHIDLIQLIEYNVHIHLIHRYAVKYNIHTYIHTCRPFQRKYSSISCLHTFTSVWELCTDHLASFLSAVRLVVRELSFGGTTIDSL